jgi:hypothetical protein
MYIQGFGGETWRKETTWRPMRRWKVILKQIFREWDGEDMDWSDVA